MTMPSLTRLHLTEFRSYAALRLETDARPVVLTGANGAGKTNILEAISFLTPGRGLRRAKLAEVQRQSSGTGTGWGVAAQISTQNGPVDIGTGRDGTASERRLVRIDGQAARSQLVLAEHLACVWLTPQMDRLFNESAGGRRRFLDRLVFGFDPEHAARLSRYDQALRERARLLREGPADAAWLAALEDQMATLGVAASAARAAMVARLNSAVALATGPFPAALLALSGTLESWLAETPALAAEDRFRAALAEGRRADAAMGGAILGPQRCDVLVRHAEKNMEAAFCSTGEQKALLISILLANARLLAAERGAPPILLFDEVAAHLDTMRRSALFADILALGAQAWMTGTDAALFDELEDAAQHFMVGMDNQKNTSLLSANISE